MTSAVRENLALQVRGTGHLRLAQRRAIAGETHEGEAVVSGLTQFDWHTLGMIG